MGYYFRAVPDSETAPSSTEGNWIWVTIPSRRFPSCEIRNCMLLVLCSVATLSLKTGPLHEPPAYPVAVAVPVWVAASYVAILPTRVTPCVIVTVVPGTEIVSVPAVQALPSAS